MAQGAGLADLPSIGGAYNFTRANNANILAAMSAMKAGADDVRVAMFGDSTTYGYEAEGASPNDFTNARIHAPPYQLAQQLTAAGIAANAENLWGNGSVIAPADTNLLAADPRITESGPSWALGGSIPVVGGDIIWNTNDADATDSVSFQTNTAVDTLRLTCISVSGAGSFLYSIDGGSFSAPVSTDFGTNFHRFTIALGSSGTHKVTLKKSAGGRIYLIGLDFYDTTSRKILCWNHGICTASPSRFLSQTQPYNVGFQYYANGQALSTINCLINPMGSPGLMADTMTDIQTMITALKGAGSDVWLVMPQPTGNTTNPRSDYLDALQTLATTNSCTLLDLGFGIADLAAWQALGYSSDNQHPNTAGYGYIAGRYKALLAAAYAAA